MSSWSNDAIELLINEYESRPYMYDVKNLMYYNRTSRSGGEHEIARLVSNIRPGTTAAEIKKKIQYLRSVYTTEIAKRICKSVRVSKSDVSERINYPLKFGKLLGSLATCTLY